VIEEGLIEESLVRLINQAVIKAFPSISSKELPTYLEIPKEYKFGDLSSTVALRLTRLLNKPSLEVANILKDEIAARINSSALNKVILKVETAPNGFINFFIKNEYLYQLLTLIIETKDGFGRQDIGNKSKVNIEFVSANPTGPLSLAHGRQAAVGDALANLLEFLGFQVTREYYLNDEGRQINLLGQSLESRTRELLGEAEKFPEDGYQGQYIYDIAKEIIANNLAIDKQKLEFFREYAVDHILNTIKKDLQDFGVTFDVWFSQKELRKSGDIDKAIELFKKKELAYEKEGALWFKSTLFGDDKDRVIIKSDGTFTYLAPDIAYHKDKFKRRFNWLINLWGPDHHGYISRLRAAVRALGHKEESLDIIIVQLATLLKGEEVISMSTRRGEFVTLSQVMKEVGKDVARFFFLARRTESHLDFDLELAKKESQENPVYYIQYAYARINSIQENALEKNIRISKKVNASLLNTEEEIALLKNLHRFPHAVLISYKLLDPYPITTYLLDLVGVFHRFYERQKVLSEDKELTQARLLLIEAVKIVLDNGLKLLGISRPKRM